ncbi:hypothetical protein SDC9_121547 [bioreactor metagenome]|uniref:Uncharacterized protein n=1 Tax=bioreactor metagenome TaxID=1076179 RepID=A0A645CC96_9ZZZZ
MNAGDLDVEYAAGVEIAHRNAEFKYRFVDEGIVFAAHDPVVPADHQQAVVADAEARRQIADIGDFHRLLEPFRVKPDLDDARLVLPRHSGVLEELAVDAPRPRLLNQLEILVLQGGHEGARLFRRIHVVTDYIVVGGDQDAVGIRHMDLIDIQNPGKMFAGVAVLEQRRIGGDQRGERTGFGQCLGPGHDPDALQIFPGDQQLALGVGDLEADHFDRVEPRLLGLNVK